MAHKNYDKAYLKQCDDRIMDVLEDKENNSDWTQISITIQQAVKAIVDNFGFSTNDQKSRAYTALRDLVACSVNNISQNSIWVFPKPSWDKILYCPFCGSTKVSEAFWLNPNTGHRRQKAEDVAYTVCDNCSNDTPLLTLPELWESFSEIPVNNADEIETGFLNFEAGTSKFDVWHWFDDRCENGLVKDLM